MGVSLVVKTNYYEVGSASFLNCFFSTVYFHLVQSQKENNYPKIFPEFFQGHLYCEDSQEVRGNILEIREKLKLYSPDKIIWDIYDLSTPPPWGNNISSQTTSLSNYFVIANGKDLFDVILAALAKSEELKADIYIR
jgi:2,3-bisphosphoglycerate-dependent phosphoglycerate mutase